MAIVPGLPKYLEEVPPAPSSPFDPEADDKRQAWKAWRDDVLRYRIEHQLEVDANPALIPIELELCKRSAAYFLTMWGSISEPKIGDPHRISGEFAWIPFEIQVEAWEWLDEVMQETGALADGVISKCRDMGASWTVIGWCLHKWLFTRPFSTLWVSRKEEEVDSKSSKSLFWKMRYLLFGLPSWMQPKGFDRNDKNWLSTLRLTDLNTNNEILGESTNANAGRGARVACMFFDEAAFIPDLLEIWAGATNTTAHKFALSTESLETDPGFYKLSHGVDIDTPPSLKVMEWWHNPNNDDDWNESIKERFATEPGKYEREVLRDPKGGDETYVYPMTQRMDVDESLEYIDGCPLHIAMDPGMNDETVIIWLQEQDGEFVVLDSFVRRSQVAAFYGCIITGHWQFLETPGVQFPFVRDFTERDYAIMRWTRELPRTDIVADSYGDNVFGVSGDSVYDVLRKPPFRLRINTDRTPQGEVSANKRVVRQFKGRREALRPMLANFRFADTLGARNVLRALQEHKFNEDTGKSVSEMTKPKHDWTSHYVSALEFFASTYQLRRSIGDAGRRRTERRLRHDSTRNHSHKWNSYGRQALGPSPYRRRVA